MQKNSLSPRSLYIGIISFIVISSTLITLIIRYNDTEHTTQEYPDLDGEWCGTHDAMNSYHVDITEKGYGYLSIGPFTWNGTPMENLSLWLNLPDTVLYAATQSDGLAYFRFTFPVPRGMYRIRASDGNVSKEFGIFLTVVDRSNDKGRRFGVNIDVQTPIENTTVSGMCNLSWYVTKTDRLPTAVEYGGNYTLVSYRLDNGITWIPIVNISRGDYFYYHHSWNTTSIPGSHHCKLKIEVVSTIGDGDRAELIWNVRLENWFG